jgi:hypothetical protein
MFMGTSLPVSMPKVAPQVEAVQGPRLFRDACRNVRSECRRLQRKLGHSG